MTSVQSAPPCDPPQNGMRVPRPSLFCCGAVFIFVLSRGAYSSVQCCMTVGSTILFVFVCTGHMIKGNSCDCYTHTQLAIVLVVKYL